MPDNREALGLDLGDAHSANAAAEGRTGGKAMFLQEPKNGGFGHCRLRYGHPGQTYGARQVVYTSLPVVFSDAAAPRPNGAFQDVSIHKARPVICWPGFLFVRRNLLISPPLIRPCIASQ